QYVVYCQEANYFGVFRLPPFETRQSSSFVWRIRNNDERHFDPRLFCSWFSAGRSYSRCFPCHFAKVWRPRRVAETGRFISVRELEQFCERTRRGIHVRVRIFDFREAPRSREYREVGRVAIRNFAPIKRSRDTGVGKRAYRICGARGPVLRILVVVKEDAMSLFFPPFRTGESGSTPLHCARKRDSCAAHFSERPARLKTHIYVHAAGTAGLGPARKPNLLEESLELWI